MVRLPPTSGCEQRMSVESDDEARAIMANARKAWDSTRPAQKETSLSSNPTGSSWIVTWSMSKRS